MMREIEDIERTVTVDNLSPETSPHDLRRLFSKVGEVTSVAIRSLTSETTMALVSMSEEGAENAVEHFEGRLWRGHRLTVRKYWRSYKEDEHDDPDPW